MSTHFALKPSALRRVCDPKVFDFKLTSELKPLDVVIGQERAVQAIEFGLTMPSGGYNIFITGEEGTGKSTIARELTGKHAKAQPVPDDWCLVNNFEDEFRPKAIALPAGRGSSFSKKVGRLIGDLKRDIPKGFESESYLKRLSEIKARHNARQTVIFKKIERVAAEHSLHIDSSQGEYPVVPIIDGKILSAEDYQRLPEQTRAEIDARARLVQDEIEKAGRKIEKLNTQLHADIERLMDAVVRQLVLRRIEPLQRDFKDCAGILEHLERLQADIVENFTLFLPAEKNETAAAPDWAQPPRAPFQKYKVNVLVQREPMKGAPVIFETNPTYANVFGRIEKRAFMGAVNADFSLVQAGALLNANGGFLIMEIEPLLTHPYVWEALKRALQTKCLTIEDLPDDAGSGTTALKPQPIPLEVKVILLGSYETFEVLQNFDSKFNKIFKVRADFDQEVSRTPETVQLYARFIARVCDEENLLPYNRQGVAAIVEFGEKYVSDQNKLSVRFGPLLGVLKEADYWARRQKAKVVSEKHVVKAFRQHRFRYSLYEQKVHESYSDGTIMIDVAGAVVGQINGLAVYQIGDFSFGRPVRITAEAFMGKPGMINIEREAEPERQHPRQGRADPLRLPGESVRPGLPPEPGDQHHLRAELQRHRRRQRLLHRALRHPLQPLRNPDPPGDRRHRLRQPERLHPGHRRGQPEDRGVLRSLPRQGFDGRAGGDHPRVQRPAPDAASGGHRCRQAQKIPRLCGGNGRRRDRDPDRGAGGRARREGGLPGGHGLRGGAAPAQDLLRTRPEGQGRLPGRTQYNLIFP